MRRLNDEAAIATARWALAGGGKPEQSGWFTLVWLRTAAGWRAVHDHSGAELSPKGTAVAQRPAVLR